MEANGGLGRAQRGRNPSGATKGMRTDAGAVAVRKQSPNTGTKAGAALVDPDKPLTEKQKLFVKYWAQGESIQSASERAGYSDNATFAYRMVYMPNILKLYNEEKRLYAEASQMTRKKVMDMLLEAYEMAKLMAEPATMVSAAREVGKMAGFYEPVERKVTVSMTGNVAIDRMNRMSDAELLKILTSPAQEAIQHEILREEDDQDGHESP